MYERVLKINFGTLVVLAAFLFIFLVARAEAATCDNGVLKDGATTLGTCTVTSGTPTTVTCSATGVLNDGTTDVGTCAIAQEAKGDLARDGVFGCNANKYANVGSLSAIGGVYVPVNDAAVTLNTGFLVYKECVLDGVIAKISEAARTDLTQTTLRRINEGRQGNPFWPKNRRKELDERDLRVLKLTSAEEFVGSMCPAFKKTVRREYIVRTLAAKNQPNGAFACTYSEEAGDMEAALRGEASGDTILEAIRGLALNNEFITGLIYDETVDAIRAAARYDQEERWRLNNGFYDVTDNNENPFEENVLTPGFLVSEGAGQLYTSGFRCLEGADELSEVCAPMFSAMIPESFNNGLYSMTRAQSGLPSYVSRMVNEASAAVRAEAVNAALNILLTTRQFEFAFKQAKDASANILTSAITRLRTVERNCWELIINNPSGPKVCASPPDSNRRCTTPDVCTTSTDGSQQCTPGIQVTVATSTQQFAQAIISAQLAPIAQNVAGDIQKSTASLQELDRLITDVTNAGSAANQRAALSRLDQLVAPNARLPDCSPQKTLHSAGDVQCANKERDDMGSAVGLLVENTVRDWGDSMDPNVGWCNVNNPAVIQRWINAWK